MNIGEGREGLSGVRSYGLVLEKERREGLSGVGSYGLVLEREGRDCQV